MFWFWHSESFLKFSGDLSSVYSWIWRSTYVSKSDLFIMLNTRKKPFSQRKCALVFVYNHHLALINFKAKQSFAIITDGSNVNRI